MALTIACIKALLVLLYFMHLRYTSKLTWAFAATGFVWLTFIIGLTMSDIVSRNWIPAILSSRLHLQVRSRNDRAFFDPIRLRLGVNFYLHFSDEAPICRIFRLAVPLLSYGRSILGRAWLWLSTIVDIPPPLFCKGFLPSSI